MKQKKVMQYLAIILWWLAGNNWSLWNLVHVVVRRFSPIVPSEWLGFTIYKWWCSYARHPNNTRVVPKLDHIFTWRSSSVVFAFSSHICRLEFISLLLSNMHCFVKVPLRLRRSIILDVYSLWHIHIVYIVWSVFRARSDLVVCRIHSTSLHG